MYYQGTGGDGARSFCRSLTISLTLTILAEGSWGSASEGGGGVMDVWKTSHPKRSFKMILSKEIGWGICEKLSHTTNYQGGRECLKSPAGGEMRERGDLGSYNTGDSCAPLTSLKRGSVKKLSWNEEWRKVVFKIRSQAFVSKHILQTQRVNNLPFWRYLFREQLTLHEKAGGERQIDYTKILRLVVGLSRDQLKILGAHCWSIDSGQWYLINSVWRLGCGVGVLGVRVVYTRLSDSPHPQVFS